MAGWRIDVSQSLGGPDTTTTRNVDSQEDFFTTRVAENPYEDPKRGFVDVTERSQKEVLNEAKKAQGTSTYLTGSEKADPSLAYSTASMQHLKQSAETGTIHSGALGMARRDSARQLALQEASLRYEDERRRRERLAQIEQLRNTVEEARSNIPTSAAVGSPERGRTMPVFTTELDRMAARDKKIQTIIDALDRRRPTEEESRAVFQREVNATYDQLKQQAIGEAQRLGAPPDYIAGLDQSFEQDRSRALRDSERFVAALSGPDPQAVQGLLSSMYTVDTIEPITQAEYDPTAALLLGLGGAVLGGVVAGPSGATAGWGFGSAFGDVLSRNAVG